MERQRIAAFAIRPWHLNQAQSIQNDVPAKRRPRCGTRYEVNSMGNIDMRHSSWPLLFRRRSFGWNPSLNEHLLVHKHSDCIDKATRLPNCVQAPDLRPGAIMFASARLHWYRGHNPTLLYLRSQSEPPWLPLMIRKHWKYNGTCKMFFKWCKMLDNIGFIR